MSANQVDWTVWQDPKVANGFADRRASVPGTQIQLDVLRRLIERVPTRNLHVLDIGCGDGFLLAKVMEFAKVDNAVALDGSAAMLERARKRFAGHPGVTLVEADFNSSQWTRRLSHRAFDAVISGYAIHHSEDLRKREIYRDVFGLLAPGGVFINVEHVASATALGEDIWEHAWAEYDAAYRRAQGEQIDFETALAQHRNSDQKAANRLASVRDQLDWLSQIGFVDVDCYCKYLELAVLAGFKPA
jgi:SAM-dependent methyltransferase